MSASKRGPRRRPETVEKRNEILRAATRTFGSKGYQNGPLTEIAEQVNMTHSGILHHFGSKEQLLLEVLTHRDRTDVEDLEGQRLPEGEETFRHLVRTAFLNARRAPIVQAYAVLSAESVTEDHPAREYFEVRYRELRGQLADAFHLMCAERGIEDPAIVTYTCASILAVMDGLQVQWLLDPGAVDLAETTAFAIEVLVGNVVGEPVSLRGAVPARPEEDPARPEEDPARPGEE